MTVKSITIEHTRQVRPYEPVRVSVTAEIREGENPEEQAKELHRLVLKLIYRDDQKQLALLITGLVDCVPKAATPIIRGTYGVRNVKEPAQINAQPNTLTEPSF